MDFRGILFPLKLARNRIYTAPAAQGLTHVIKLVKRHCWSHANSV